MKSGHAGFWHILDASQVSVLWIAVSRLLGLTAGWTVGTRSWTNGEP